MEIKAYRCDRCNKLYEEYEISYPTIGLVAYKKKSKDYSIIAEINVCEKCYKQLIQWFKKEQIKC